MLASARPRANERARRARAGATGRCFCWETKSPFGFAVPLCIARKPLSCGRALSRRLLCRFARCWRPQTTTTNPTAATVALAERQSLLYLLPPRRICVLEFTNIKSTKAYILKSFIISGHLYLEVPPILILTTWQTTVLTTVKPHRLRRRLRSSAPVETRASRPVRPR